MWNVTGALGSPSRLLFGGLSSALCLWPQLCSIRNFVISAVSNGTELSGTDAQ